MKTIVLIPARLAATRLPNKPLLDIAGQPMIVHVWRRALEADLGPVTVATDHADIAAAITKLGGHAILTRADHPSGTDRIAEALATIDPGHTYDTIVNFQGDLPTVDPAILRQTAALLHNPATDIATPVARITDDADTAKSHIVKMVGTKFAPGQFRALYFTRAPAPWGPGPHYHHIGLYVWRRAALERFVRLPPSPLECREKLEQLRALEAGLRIDAALVDDVPLGVDTQEDLDAARQRLSLPALAASE